jgi:predicted MFS family arabinose efflux permease
LRAVVAIEESRVSASFAHQRSALRNARLAVLAVFFFNGLVIGSWVVRIPAVKEKLGLGDGLLGVALLGMAVGALVAMPIVGALVSRFGSRRIVGVAALVLAASLLAPALAPSLFFLVPALLLLGAANGGLDVAMNAQAVAVERGYGRPIMSSFHAAWSFGGLGGAALGGLLASKGIGPLPHFAAGATLVAVAFVVAYGSLLPSQADASGEGTPAFARPTRALLGLGIISFCVLLGEGAMGDWSAVYLDDTLKTGPGFAAAGYAAFSLSMAFGRLFGDRFTELLGPATLVRSCAAIAAVGLGVALAAAQPIIALAGFACAGAGFSIIFPTALSAAGRTGGPTGPALAAVTTAAYTGFLVGPPFIGFLAELTGLGYALYLVIALSATIILLAGTVNTGSEKPK